MNHLAGGADSPLGPEYYIVVASEEERRLRADYARIWTGLEAMQPEQSWRQLLLPILVPGAAETQALDELARHWREHPARYWRGVYRHLHETAVSCEQQPTAMRSVFAATYAALADGAQIVEPVRWRNHLQAAELTQLMSWHGGDDQCADCGGEGIDDTEDHFSVCGRCRGSGEEPGRGDPWAGATEIANGATGLASTEAPRENARELTRHGRRGRS